MKVVPFYSGTSGNAFPTSKVVRSKHRHRIGTQSHENRISALEEDSAQMRGHRSIELICEKVLQSQCLFYAQTVPKMHRQDLLPFNFLLRQEYAALQRAYITLRSDAEIVLQSLTDPSTASEEVIQAQSNLQASRVQNNGAVSFRIVVPLRDCQSLPGSHACSLSTIKIEGCGLLQR